MKMYIYSFISYISLKRQINKEDVLHSAQKDADKAIKKKKNNDSGVGTKAQRHILLLLAHCSVPILPASLDFLSQRKIPLQTLINYKL